MLKQILLILCLLLPLSLFADDTLSKEAEGDLAVIGAAAAASKGDVGLLDRDEAATIAVDAIWALKQSGRYTDAEIDELINRALKLRDTYTRLDSLDKD